MKIQLFKSKKLFMIIIGLIALAVITTSSVFALTSESDQFTSEGSGIHSISEISKEDCMDYMLQFGQIQGSADPKYADEIILQGKNLSVNNGEVQRMADQYAIRGEENGRTLAINYILRRESLYHKSLSEGNSVTDQEAWDYVNIQKEAGRKVGDQDDYKAFLSGIQMTNDEYWDSQFDFLKQELIILQYFDSLKEDFAQQRSISTWNEETNKTWEVYYADVVQQLIDEEEVVEVTAE